MIFATATIITAMLITIAVPLTIGILVYRDAKKRCMDAILWALAAALIPGFIGLIIYLIVRYSHSAITCAKCGNTVRDDFATCPYCGASLKYRCPDCGAPTEPDWAVCAYCGKELPRRDPSPTIITAQESSKKFWVLVGCLVLIPILLVAIGIITFGLRTHAGHSRIENYPIEYRMEQKTQHH